MKTGIALALVALLIAPGTPSQPAIASATFHHFHFRVGDPAAAMNHAASSMSGTRVLLRGLGVGVRVGTVHALFDRLDGSESAGAGGAEAAYAAAASWLRARGVLITEDAKRSASRAALAEMFRTERLDHVAFTTSDLAGLVAAVRTHGIVPVRESDEAVMFRPADVPAMEVVRDIDAPDAFWCPMHVDVRSSAPGKCPVCGMALVPIPPPRLGEYRMDVTAAGSPRGGIARLRIAFREPDTDRRVDSFATVHDRLLHLFIIDRSLEFFRHVHPQPVGDGTFELREEIPPGEYVLMADFLPRGGVSQMVQRAIATPGYKGPLFPPPPDLSGGVSVERIAWGVRVQLEPRALKAGREGSLRFTLSDAATGVPIRDLEPFLGAPGHMLIVNADLTEADHVHPEEPIARGPSLTFQPLPAAGGFYKLWLQFQRKGMVTTVPFVVRVEER